MNKFTKIGAVSLLTMFLAACDKPASSASTAEVAKPQTNQQQSPELLQGVEDYKKLSIWSQEQNKIIEEAHLNLQKELGNKDHAKSGEALKLFSTKVNGVLNSLEKLDIKNAEIAVFKEKLKESLILSNEFGAELVKAMGNSTPEIKAMLQEKSQKMLQIGAEVQKLQAELDKKFSTK